MPSTINTNGIAMCLQVQKHFESASSTSSRPEQGSLFKDIPFDTVTKSGFSTFETLNSDNVAEVQECTKPESNWVRFNTIQYNPFKEFNSSPNYARDNKTRSKTSVAPANDDICFVIACWLHFRT